MCTPLLFAAGSGLVSLIGGAAAASGQRAAGRANQQIAENNATLSDQQAKDAAILGARESQKAAWQTRAAIGAQRAAIAAAGIDSETGTPADILGDTALLGGASQSAIAMDAARKAWGFNSEALNYRNQGRLDRWQGNQSATTTLLGSLGSAIGSFSGYSRGGGGGGGSSSGSGGGGYGAPWAPGPGYGGP